MTKYITLAVVFVALTVSSLAQGLTESEIRQNRNAAISALTTIDENLVGYFPRWKLCEPDLSIKLKHVFKLYNMRPEDERGEIRITAAPKPLDDPAKPFDLLLIQWGRFSNSESAVSPTGSAPLYVTLNSQDIRSKLPPSLRDVLSGAKDMQGYEPEFPTRSYCYFALETRDEPTEEEIREMVNFFQPTSKNHAITISVFEQALKLGQGGSQTWVNLQLGTDQIGLPFWSSGEGRILVRQIPIPNRNPDNNAALPSILALKLGLGYRVTAGLPGDNAMLNFVASRHLDAGPGGKVVAGFELNMPGMEAFGVGVNAELPLRGLTDNTTFHNIESYFTHQNPFPGRLLEADYMDSTAFLLRNTGQVTAFYNWWPSTSNHSNFFRFDAGINYTEVAEAAILRLDVVEEGLALTRSAKGLRFYKPAEVLDWIYLKAEYFNQSGRPFGMSAQFSNQMLLTRVFVPVVGNWLYLEAKYAQNMRSNKEIAARPFDIQSFFMFSPVIRLSL